MTDAARIKRIYDQGVAFFRTPEQVEDRSEKGGDVQFRGQSIQTPDSRERNQILRKAILDWVRRNRPGGPANKPTMESLGLYHNGGMVKGYNRGGEVPIIAQEGEYVMSRQAVNSIGRGTMEAINKYHSGGLVQYRQTGGAASTGPIVTGTDVGQLQQVQSFNTLAKIGKDQIGATTKIGENQIGATNNISTNVVNKLDTLNKNIKDVRGISAIGFTVLNKNIASIDARIFDIYLHTMGIDWVEDEIETLQDINKKIQGINKKILNKVRAITPGS